MAKKDAIDLLDSPVDDFEVTESDPPVTKGMGFLASTSGPKLEMMTRTTRPIVKGISAGSAYIQCYRSDYIGARVERLERLAVSEGGLGRSEMIQMVGAGGPVTDAYYDRGSKRPPMDYAVEDN